MPQVYPYIHIPLNKAIEVKQHMHVCTPYCTMVTPSDDKHINPGTHRAYLFKDTFLRSKKNVGDRNSGEFFAHTNKLGPWISIRIDRPGLHGFVDWIVVQGWRTRTTLLGYDIRTDFLSRLLCTEYKVVVNSQNGIDSSTHLSSIQNSSTYSVALYIQGIEQTQRQNKENKIKKKAT